MTATNDLDRALATWLADGPTRAPEPPMDAAVAHARRHPRRPDPLRLLRGDVMAPRSLPFGIQPALALLVVGLLVTALVGVAVVGSWRDAPVVVPPGPVPSAEPSPTPSPSPRVFDVTLDQPTAATMTVTVIDRSGRLVAARSGPAADGGSVAEGVAVEQLEPTVVRLTWTDSVCSIDYALDIDPTGRVVAIEGPPCVGDTFPQDRVLDLEFAEPVDAAAVEATIVVVP